MIRPILHDEAFLAQKAEAATAEDRETAQDLRDTLTANRKRCVGMAANMIGVNRRLIIFQEEDGSQTVLFNPEIIHKEGPYKATEGCLSLTGTRDTVRYKKIKVRYQNEQFQVRFKTWTGYTAQIIQHEIDHCDGILI